MKRCAACGQEYDDAYDGCPFCARQPVGAAALGGESSSNPNTPFGMNAATLNEHGRRLDEIERLLNSSNVYHFQFWPRAWAILGHNLSAGLIIYIVGLMVIAILAAILGQR